MGLQMLVGLENYKLGVVSALYRVYWERIICSDLNNVSMVRIWVLHNPGDL